MAPEKEKDNKFIDQNAKDVLDFKEKKAKEDENRKRKIQLEREKEALAFQYSHKDGEVKRLLAGIGRLKREIAGIAPELSREKDDVVRVKREIDKHQTGLDDLTKRVGNKSADLSALIEREKNEIVRLTTELKMHDSKLRKLRSELDSSIRVGGRGQSGGEREVSNLKKQLVKEEADVVKKVEFLEERKGHLYRIEGDVKTFISDANELQKKLLQKKVELDKVR